MDRLTNALHKRTSALTPSKRGSKKGKGKGILTFNRRQAQLARNLRVTHLARLAQRHPAHELGQVAAARDRGAAAECLELDLLDALRRRVDADLELHDVSAGRGADQARTHRGIGFRERADVPRGRVVVEDFFVVGAAVGGLGGCDGSSGNGLLEKTRLGVGGREGKDTAGDGRGCETTEHSSSDLDSMVCNFKKMIFGEGNGCSSFRLVGLTWNWEMTEVPLCMWVANAYAGHVHIASVRPKAREKCRELQQCALQYSLYFNLR